MGIGQAVSAKIVYLKPERMHARTGIVARAPRVHASEIAFVRTANGECAVRLCASRNDLAQIHLVSDVINIAKHQIEETCERH